MGILGSVLSGGSINGHIPSTTRKQGRKILFPKTVRTIEELKTRHIYLWRSVPPWPIG